MTDELYHYGVKGMKWGVRRYQNKDGTLTPSGKQKALETRRIKNVSKYKNDIEDIVSTLSKSERKRMNLDDDEEYMPLSEGKKVVSIFLEKKGDIPVSVFDLTDYGKGLNASVVTRSGDEYRGKGYANDAVKKGLKWYNKNKSKLDKPITWWATKDNVGSQKLAEKNGFRKDLSLEKSDDEWLKNNWVKYIYD